MPLYQELSQQLTKIFTQSYSSEIVHDYACRLICKTFSAASVTFLLYKGAKDQLVSNGRYIDPDRSRLEAGKPLIRAIFKDISAYEFIYEKKRISAYKSIEEFHRQYCSYLQGEALNVADFTQIFEDFRYWKADYEKIKKNLREEAYHICSSDSPEEGKTISGVYYAELLGGNSTTNEIRTRFIPQAISEDRQYCRNHLPKIDTRIAEDLYYIGVPLESNGRLIGILRMLLPQEEKWTSLEMVDQWVEAHRQGLYFLVSIIGLQVEQNNYLEGYRSLTSSSATVHLRNTEEVAVKQFIKKQCDLLTELVNCKGTTAWLHFMDGQPMQTRSDSVHELFLELTDPSLAGKPSLSDLNKYFPKDHNVTAVSFKDCLTRPITANKICYYQIDEDVVQLGETEFSEAEILPHLEGIDFFFKLFQKHKIANLLIFKLPNKKDSFFAFYNTANNFFSSKDIEILFLAIKKIDLELRHVFDNRKERQMKIIEEMHGDIDTFLSQENFELETGKVIETHRKKFREVIQKTLEKFEMFDKIIIWDCVSELLPDSSKEELEFIFHNPEEKPKPLSHYQLRPSRSIDQLQPHYARIKIAKKDFEEKRNAYHEDPYVQKFLDFIPAKGFSYFEIPIFSNSLASKQANNYALNSLITVTYKEYESEELHDDYIHTLDFTRFIRFFGTQVSMVWNKLTESITEIIRSKIENVSGELVNKGVLVTMESELRQFSLILTAEFKCDLCCFFLASSDHTSLKLIASSKENLRTDPYSLEKDKESLSVRAFLDKKDYRLIGRRHVQKYTEPERLKIIEEQLSGVEILGNSFDYCVEHWLSVVIKLGKKRKPKGLVKLYQLAPKASLKSDLPTLIQKPFSEFETNLLRKIQANIYHIIEDRLLYGERDEIVRNIVHQVISPLNALRLHSINIREGVVKDGKDLNDRLKYIVVMAEIASERARSFQMLLDLENKSIRPRLRKLPNFQQKLIDKAIDYQPMARAEKGIGIRVEEKDEKFTLTTDWNLLNHVVTNLLDNAIKYSFSKEEFRTNVLLRLSLDDPKPDRTINLDLESTKHSVSFTVTNWGPEILEEDREKIFSRYFRGKNAIRFFISGHGIGLFLAREIIQALKGTLTLEPSENKNFIKFKITLPQ